VGWAKNGDEVFWEEKKFHAASGKAQACTQGALLFSLLCFGGGGGFFFKMGQSNWFWPRILAQFAEESEHSGGFTNPELPHQARVDTIFLYK